MSLKKRWKLEEIKLLRELYPIQSNQELSKLFGRPRKRIIEKAGKLGLHKSDYLPTELWTPEEELLLSAFYENTPWNELEQVFNRSGMSIKTKANRLGFSRDRGYVASAIRKALIKKIVNQNYFDKIDTDAKAYFLGLLWADGGLSNNRYRSQTLLKLIERDKYILDSFQKELKSDYKRIYRVEKFGQNTYSLTISSKRIFDALVNYNIVPNKTYLNLSLPTLSRHLIRHFFRGIFAGDGCISGKIGGRCASIVGSEYTCQWALEVTQKYWGVGGGVYKIQKPKNVLHTWAMSGRHQLTKLAHWLYDDASFFLSRKYNKFLGLVVL